MITCNVVPLTFFLLIFSIDFDVYMNLALTSNKPFDFLIFGSF